MRLATALLVLISLLSIASAQTGTLRLLTDYVDSMGARCLDGSPAAYYYSPGSGADVNNWILFIEGGGWCYSPSLCYGRSLTPLGSSSSYNTTVPNEDGMTGIWSTNCTQNPTFCQWTRVFLKYCDGTSFTSFLNEPVNYEGHNLYFRGRANLDAVLADLPYLKIGNGWNAAENVLLTGCSAGGLSTYHAADHVAARLPKSVKKYVAIPVSGYFLMTNNVLHQPIYPMEMASIFALANCSYGVSSACLAAHPGTSQWQCIFAQNALPYIKTPIFLLNSAFDWWQMLCEFYANASTCGTYWPTSTFTPQQWTAWNTYGPGFTLVLNSTANYHRSGNGGFIHSCVTHCEGVSAYWNQFSIGGVTMQQAVTKWWNANGEGNNWYWDCPLYSTSAPYDCNPSCNSFPTPGEAAKYVE